MLFCGITLAATPGALNAPYAIQTDTLDGGGRRSSVGVYTNDGSTGLIIGNSAAAPYSADQGYIAQIGAFNPPTITAITNRTINENTTTGAIAITIGDNETAAGSLALAATSSNATLVPNNPANLTFGGAGASRDITVTPLANQFGVTTITVTVTDAEGGKATSSFVLTVNDVPVLAFNLAQNCAASGFIDINNLRLQTTDGDQTATQLTYTVTTAVANGTLERYVSAFGGGTATPLGIGGTFKQDDIDNKRVRYTNLNPAPDSFVFNVSDGAGGSVSGTFNISIGSNTLPTISPIVVAPFNEDTTSAITAFTIGDTETDPALLTVAGASSNAALIPVANIVFSGSGANRSLTLTPVANQFGTATITVTVSDSSLGTAQAQFVATVNSINDLPTVSAITAQSTNEDTATSAIAFTVGDIETAAGSLLLSYSSSNTTLLPNNSPGVTFGGTGASRSVTILPALDQFGSTDVTITVTDANGGTISTLFTLTVVAVNDPPVFTKGLDQTATENPTLRVVTGWATGISGGPANEPGQTVSFTLTPDKPGLFDVAPTVSSNGTLTFTPGNQISANTIVTVTVVARDDGGVANGGNNTSAAQTFTITLTPVAEALIVTNTNDTGAGSFRDCLLRAGSGDTVRFDPVVFAVANPDTATTINVFGSQLPSLAAGNVIVDARNQRVTINGLSNINCGLEITSSNNRIMGLSIIQFAVAGICIKGGAQNNVIGGSRALSAGAGPNGEGLRIGKCLSKGIDITDAGTNGNTVKGCWVGLASNGSSAEPNLAGIVIENGAQANVIGSAIAEEANVIAGNDTEGISVNGAGTDGNVIIGNLVGVAAPILAGRSVSSRVEGFGRQGIGNGKAGIAVQQGVANTKIGGSDDTVSNLIGFNGTSGIDVRDPASRRMSSKRNRISRNLGSGIKLASGSNDNVQPPIIMEVIPSQPGAVSRGNIRGIAAGAGEVQVFNDPGSQAGTLVGTASVGSNGSWELRDVAINPLERITATFTDANDNTSELMQFSGSIFNPDDIDNDGIVNALDIDNDNDGFSDELEVAFGTSPFDKLDTPFGGAAASQPISLSIKKAAVKISFKGQDTISLSGFLPVPVGFKFSGEKVTIDFGGVVRKITLDTKGAQKFPDRFKLSAKIDKKTSAAFGDPATPFSVKFAKGTYDTFLKDEMLTNEVTVSKQSRTVKVAILFNNQIYEKNLSVTYSAKATKTGSAKFP